MNNTGNLEGGDFYTVLPRGDSKIWSRAPRNSDPKTTTRWGGPGAERAPHITNPQLSDSNKNLVVSPWWVLYSKIDWQSDVGRNIDLDSEELELGSSKD
jgi:hypothetical protein